jgi:carboxylesterase
MENEKIRIIPTAEPFFYPGGPTGCLLIHGFTGTPKEMRLLGDYLHQQGHTVLGVRLAGHATRVEDMIRSRYRDWLASVEDGWHLLQGQTERVFVVGFSMGGVLALTMSASFPVAGVVSLATPYEIPNKLAKTLGPLLILLSKIKPTMAQPEDQWFTPEMKIDHVCYPEPPLRCVYELIQLTKKMQSLLPTLDFPVLVIHSKDDKAVPPENGEMLFDHIGSQDKTHIWVKDCSHNFVRDGDTSKVFEPIGEFIRRVNQAEQG